MRQKELSHTYPGLDLNKKYIRLWDTALSQEILVKIYFVVKPLKKVLIRGGEFLSAPFYQYCLPP